MKRELLTRIKKVNASERYSIYLLENGLFRVEKWGKGAFPLYVTHLNKNLAFELKHIKDSKLPKFVLNYIINYDGDVLK